MAGSPRLRRRKKLRFLVLMVTGAQRPHGTGDAAILLGIVRFERIVQLIEEDRQLTVTLAQRGDGVEKPVERAFGAVGDSRTSRRAASQRSYFCKV
jgi:hypothetical protein